MKAPPWPKSEHQNHIRAWIMDWWEQLSSPRVTVSERWQLFIAACFCWYLTYNLMKQLLGNCIKVCWRSKAHPKNRLIKLTDIFFDMYPFNIVVKGWPIIILFKNHQFHLFMECIWNHYPICSPINLDYSLTLTIRTMVKIIFSPLLDYIAWPS